MGSPSRVGSENGSGARQGPPRRERFIGAVSGADSNRKSMQGGRRWNIADPIGPKSESSSLLQRSSSFIRVWKRLMTRVGDRRH